MSTTPPLPAAGGAYVRQPDGTLQPEKDTAPAARKGRKPSVEGGVEPPVKEA